MERGEKERMKKEKRSLLRGWKRGMAVMLGIILTVIQLSIPVTAAEETETKTEMAATGLCEHHPEHTDACGYIEAVNLGTDAPMPGSPCTFVCEECNKGEAGTNVCLSGNILGGGVSGNGSIANMAVLSTETSEYVATVGGLYYTDFMEALKATYNNSNNWCKLLKNVEVNGNIGEDYGQSAEPASWQIDLGGYSLTCGTLNMFGMRGSKIKGTGTVNANIIVNNACFVSPLTINGNIRQDGNTSLWVQGSGVFRVNGDIADFRDGSYIKEGITIVCTGTCSETDLGSYLQKNGNILITAPSNLTAAYGQSLSDISLPAGWEWVNKDISVSVGTQSYTARFNTAGYEPKYDFTNVDGYNQDNHYVERDLSVNVSKGATALAITTESMDKTYDGSAVAKPSVSQTGSTKDVTFTWYEKNGEDWTLLSSAPVNAGSYKVVAKVEADDNYSGAERERTFTVTQRQLADSMIAAIADQYYTGAAIEPDITVTDTAGIKESDYIVSYSDNINVGTATVTITGQNNYTGTASKTFTIENNNASDIIPNGGGYTSDKLHTVNDIQTEPLTNFLPLRTINQDEDEKGPFIKGDDGREGWSVIGEQIGNADDGDTVIVDMNGSTTVPGDVIESIAGRDVTIVFDMGDGITWSVNGKSVTADNIPDINLGVSRDTKNIPVDVINHVTGERYSMTITIEHDGEFGFTAVLTVNMEKKNAGLYASLFYYNKAAEELEFVCADEIDAEGNAELSFTHASDYTIVIDEESMDPNRESDNADISLSDDANTEVPAAPKTGQDTDEGLNQIWVILIGAVIILIGIGGYVFYTIRKKENDGR